MNFVSKYLLFPQTYWFPLVLIFFLTSPETSFAKWENTSIGDCKDPESAYCHYTDFKNAKIRGDRIFIWHLRNFDSKVIRTHGTESMKILEE